MHAYNIDRQAAQGWIKDAAGEEWRFRNKPLVDGEVFRIDESFSLLTQYLQQIAIFVRPQNWFCPPGEWNHDLFQCIRRDCVRVV